MTRVPLVLTGAPAVGKSVTARALAERRTRCAFVEVDDLRQLVLSGGVAPWDGVDGLRQQRLGAANACALARNFLSEDIEVVIADVLTPGTQAIYRHHLPGCRIVRLTVSWAEALRRAGTRQVWLTDDEFRLLHDADAADPPKADHVIDVDRLDPAAQLEAVEGAWCAES